jgi:hypothetical protein
MTTFTGASARPTITRRRSGRRPRIDLRSLFGQEFRQYLAERRAVGRSQARGEQGRYQLQVRVNGSKQRSLAGVRHRYLQAAQVVAGRPTGNDSGLLHPHEQPAHAAFAEQYPVPQLFLPRAHAGQVGEVHEDVEPFQRELVFGQHLVSKLPDDLPVDSEEGLPELGLLMQPR